MAKQQSTKQLNKNSEATEVDKVAPEAIPKAEVTTPPTGPPSPSGSKKDSARPKKQASAKNGSLLPSAYKLEQLKAAVTAAGNTENLLMILNYVEEAGGKAEVTESIEAYRMLKTVLEE